MSFNPTPLKVVRRPIVYEAIQWDGTERCFTETILPFAGDIWHSYSGSLVEHRVTLGSGLLTVPTPHGLASMRSGDWIIRVGVDLDVVSGDEFAQSYQPLANVEP